MASEQVTSIISKKAIDTLKEVQTQLEIMRNCELELNKLGVEIKNFNIEFTKFQFQDDFLEIT